MNKNIIGRFPTIAKPARKKMTVTVQKAADQGRGQPLPHHDQDQPGSQQSHTDPTESASQPLILTLRLDQESEKLLTGLRTKYFPKRINFLSSHITLFHALPMEREGSRERYETLFSSIAAKEPHPFTLGIKDPFLLGGKHSTTKGVALRVASHKLRSLHEGLKRELLDEKGLGVGLTEQDRQGLRPHVTVTNKVPEEFARRCLAELMGEGEVVLRN